MDVLSLRASGPNDHSASIKDLEARKEKKNKEKKKHSGDTAAVRFMGMMF